MQYMNRPYLSKLRQEARQMKARRSTLERVAMSFVPMVAGSLYERRFRPGGAPAHYLSIPTPQNSWQRYVRKDELDYFRRRADHLREYVNAMAEWVRVNKEIEHRLRLLGKGRCEKLEIRRKKKPAQTGKPSRRA
jgi:hypothetical protein